MSSERYPSQQTEHPEVRFAERVETVYDIVLDVPLEELENALAPRIFQVDSEGYLHLLRGEDVPTEDQAEVTEAIAQCPMSALSQE